MDTNYCNIKVMMFGGRRSGKTSILASMQRCFENVFGGKTNLVLSVAGSTMDTLEEKYNECTGYFNGSEREVVMDDHPSDQMKTYTLNIGMHNKKGKIALDFIDYPGEWLMKGHNAEFKQLEQTMKKCNIVMITVDTVHLMEKAKTSKGDSVGMYNDYRNYCFRISQMIKTQFLVDDENNKFPKMIMFVPLKCEKYYNAGQMNLVRERIHTAYKDLFNFVGYEDNKSKYEVIITPILTLGEDVEFSRFEINENGDIDVDKETGLPVKPLYAFKKPINECIYKPRFCEQPLLYSLAYLLNLTHTIMNAKRKHANWIEKIIQFVFEWFGNLAVAEDFLSEEETIKKRLHKDMKDGYEIVQNPLRF